MKTEPRSQGVAYAADGYCLSGSLLDDGVLEEARRAVGRVMAGRYETGVDPTFRNWYPGDPHCSLVKIDLPHLCDSALQRLVADRRIGAWVAGVLDARLVQLWACELLYKHPTSDTTGAGAVGWHQDDHAFRHWEGEACTVWLPLVDVDDQLGAIRYVPGSHLWGPQDRALFFFQSDLDRQQQEIGTPAGQVWREAAVRLPAGAVSMHHRLTLHASGSNRGESPRIAFALHLRTERARLVSQPTPPTPKPDLSDSYACPVLFGELAESELEPERGKGTVI